MYLHSSSHLLGGVADDHLLGLAALALLPLAHQVFKRQPGFATASWRDRIVAWLLAATAVIHVGLIPGHLIESPATALLFLVNGVMFGGLAVAVFHWRLWRPAATGLLLATIVAYGIYVFTGRESVDDLGSTTKLVEILALALTVMPRHPGGARWSAATSMLLLTTLVAGILGWGGILRDHAGALRQEVPIPSAADRQAAAAFAQRSWEAVAPYRDVDAALAAGYRPTTPPTQATIHYENAGYGRNGGPVMDPARPQGLVYASGTHGKVLLGSMFVLTGREQHGPDFGGAITSWHEHPNACISPLTLNLSGLLTPFGNCPPFSFNIVTTPMLHVWRPDMPNGAFGELDERWARRVAEGQA